MRTTQLFFFLFALVRDAIAIVNGNKKLQGLTRRKQSLLSRANQSYDWLFSQIKEVMVGIDDGGGRQDMN